MKPWSLTLRLFVVGAVLVAGFGWFALRQVLEEVKPAVRQSTEETLVDTANLLAELVAEDLREGRLAQGDLARVMAAYGQRHPGADIWGIRKDGVTHRITITDSKGIVLLDSAGRDVGKDYSRWNDVARTLGGRYGARTTEEIPGDERSTVMYVAAPVREGERIIGVVTVAKPNRSVQPFIERAQQRLGALAGVFIALALGIGAALSFWLSRAIRRLTVYADAVTAGERPVVPRLPGRELTQLAQALDSMRAQLEGKAYVERYVQTLTHELKSPLAAIRGASELLHGDLPPPQRARLLENIEVETSRLQAMSERLLNLAQVEQRRVLDEQVPIPLRPLVEDLVQGRAPQAAQLGLVMTNDVPGAAVARGERFLVRQALANLLDNALDFTARGGAIRISAAPDSPAGMVAVEVFNQGEPIPEYALPRVTERFYSLPRPGSGRKSTGLGLNFVQEVAQLHGGAFSISNVAHGVRATLTLPAA
ncbi:MAG TPA: two-component system sensor histidine kinase CreC [Steroidobacteraceae bacterium]|nr:two-component system sensor histidine kinase CreC [Steroidobacteraceae bacterium]